MLFSLSCSRSVGTPPPRGQLVGVPAHEARAHPRHDIVEAHPLATHRVERLGGKIWVEPAPEGGTHFKFTLANADSDQ